MHAPERMATAFVTDPLGLVGTTLVPQLVARGHRVLALARTFEEGERVRRAGALPVMGDLGTPGRWQDEAAADWVFHLAPLGSCHLRRRRRGARRTRTGGDTPLFDAIGSGRTVRLVYAADAACYGAQGPVPITEDQPARPTGSRRSILPALDELDGYTLAGFPIITAFLGLVYGSSGWLRHVVVNPLLAGRRVLEFGHPGPLVSPVHVHDCGRALIHLAERAAVGGRYFLVNSDPLRVNDFATTCARLAGRRLRLWRLPLALARALVHPSLAAHLHGDAALSNIRLRGLGFHFDLPTVERGLQRVLDTL